MLYKTLFLLARTDFKYHEGDSGTGLIICAIIAIVLIIDYIMGGDITNRDK